MAYFYAKQNKKEEAVGSLKQAMDKGFKDWSLMAKAPDLKNIRNTEYHTDLIGRHKNSNRCELQGK